MSKLDDINNDMKRCQRDIDNYNGELRSLEKKCDKLLEFGSVVKSSQGSFASVVSSDKNCLNSVKAISNINNCAKAFNNGANNYLSNTGGRVIRNVYEELINRINREAVNMMDRIDNCKSKINNCNNKMNNMKNDYKKEKEKMEKEKSNKK